ncbi:MAG: hypothetical protein WAK16_08710 [Candidatus Cybelea sp.]|jgi:hypothetical protein
MIDPSRAAAAAALLLAGLFLAACGANTSPPTVLGQPGPLVQRSSKPKSCETKPCIYVANGNGNSITAYPETANGNVAPALSISGPATSLEAPSGVALDASGKIYVSNSQGASVLTVYSPGSHGNVAPVSRIIDERSGDYIAAPGGVNLDADDNIYIPGVSSNSMSVYAAGAYGNAKPIQFIEGRKTKLDAPRTAAVAKNHTIYTCNYSGDSVTVYASGASGNVAPIRTISGNKTNLNGCTGLALDSAGNIYTSNYLSGSSGPAGINVFAKGAKGNVRPIATIAGAKTGIDGADGVALDSGDNIYVADYNTANVYVFAKGAKGNVPPIRTIGGRHTLLDAPDGLTVH